MIVVGFILGLFVLGIVWAIAGGTVAGFGLAFGFKKVLKVVGIVLFLIMVLIKLAIS